MPPPPRREPPKSRPPPPRRPPPQLRRTETRDTEVAELPSFWQLHTLGLTMAAIALSAVLLSVLPLPDSLRPFPLLTSVPVDALRAALWPKRGRNVDPQPAGAEGEPAERAMVFDEMDLTGDGASGVKGRLDDREARRWEQLIEGTQATHTTVEDPCLDAACTKTALTPFFVALRGLADGTAKAPVRVVTLGTSLIASDHITDVTRRLLQTRHGSGGLGFMFVDRPTRNAGRTVRSGSASPGWVIEKITDQKPLKTGGLGGVAFTAPGDKSQETTFLAVGTRRAELFLVAQPGGGILRAFADSTPLGSFATDGQQNQPIFQTVQVPPDVTRLTLRTVNGPVRLDGVVLENGTSGLVFDSIGLPGATAQVLLRDDPALFQAQLEQRNPKLVVMMIGGNDAFDISQKRYTPQRGQESMQELINRVKAGAPEAACLLAAPPDAGIWRMDKTIATRMETKQVGAYMRELAQTNGCAYYDMQAAMGGEGAVSKWWAAGLMNRDLVHPLGVGGDVMGYMLDLALEKARQRHEAGPKGTPRGGRTPSSRSRPLGRTPHVEAHATATLSLQTDAGVDLADGGQCATDAGVVTAPPPFLARPDALVGFFQKLKHLETTGTGRVAMAQLGASHTAAQYFTDEVRRLFADRFGYAGRGFVAAGKTSNRLEQSGVARALYGQWKITDALAIKTSGLTWGLTGIRAEAGVGASMEVAFDEPGAGPDDFARVQVYYQDRPDGPVPDVRIDGRSILVPTASDQPIAAVRVLELGVPGSRHLVSVANPGPGPLSVFGVSHELIRPGIVYDAFGLPGSTAMTLASYAQQPLAQQLEARQVDLFVLFYGTNESSLHAPAIEEMKRSYPLVLATLRLSSPDAACLFLGPTDRMSKKPKGWREVESINAVQAAVRLVAEQNGCAFWSTRDVMGGKDSIEVWRKQKLANKDHVHLTPEGYQKLAGNLFGDLMRVYDAWSSAE